MPTIIRFGGGAGDGAQKLVVNVVSGATVTARKGSVAVSAVSENGQAVLELDEAGTYTVSASKDGITMPDVKTATVPQEITFVSAELNANSWGIIKKVSDAGHGANYWSVGDCKSVVLNGTVGYGSSARTFSNQEYWVYIIGFEHNSAKEGKGIAFQGFKTAQTGGIDIAVTGTNYGSTGSGMVMNGSNTNAGGWNGSWAHTTCMAQWKNCFPSELQAVIRTTTLYTDNTGNSSTDASAVTSNENQVYYLAEYEVFGINTYANTNEPAQQAQYDYYKAGNSKVKYRSDDTSTAAIWWLRSPRRSSSYNFCFVRANGSTNNNNAFNSEGSAPAFKV